jgi:molybdopterin synthase catalytic subunit/molybdopterin converting factor small subunit
MRPTFGATGTPAGWPILDNRDCMRVKLLAFGILRDQLGSSMGPLELPAGSTVRDLLDRCRSLAPGNGAAVWSSIAVAVNEEYVPATHRLADGDEVALLPPVSGGKDVSRPGPDVRLVQEPIVAHDIVARLARPEDGGIVVFDGVVRNNSRGRKTRYLEYEAYGGMALKQMQVLAGRALADFPIRDIAIVHRLGRLEIGESSVLIAVFSAHRAAAFDACRWLIDTLKQTVPIWKKEFFEDGAVWAQGDPFPPELTANGKSRKPAKSKSASRKTQKARATRSKKPAKRRPGERAR